MSLTIDQPSRKEVRREPEQGAARGFTWPRLLPGTELIGQAKGSGLREPPYLVRRCDGQVVQLSRVLFVVASCMDGRGPEEIADHAGPTLDLRLTSDQVAYVAEHKLAPLGLIPYRDGRMPNLERRNALLALRFRVGIVPERAVNAVGDLLRPLFLPPLVIATMAALVACDVWLGTSHSIAEGLRTVIYSPSLALALFTVLLFSLALHEFGHAAACRYGGARVGRIGVGIYLIWPVFYTDVTDSWRLAKAGRLRTDLGGVYFNALVALSASGAYIATAYKPLVIVVVTQQILILDQFIPWMRLDGYHIVSDLIGVSDLFARIKPVVASLLPGRRPDPRVTELKRWARAAVTVWVTTAIAALLAMAVVIVRNAASYLTSAWQSLILQLDALGRGARVGSVVDVLNGAIGTISLLIPVVGVILSYLLLCHGIGTSLAIRRGRVDITLTQ